MFTTTCKACKKEYPVEDNYTRGKLYESSGYSGVITDLGAEITLTCPYCGKTATYEGSFEVRLVEYHSTSSSYDDDN